MWQRSSELAQSSAVDLHVDVRPVAVCLPAQRRHALSVVRTAEALVVADHVRDCYTEPAPQPVDQPQACLELPRVGEDLLVAVTDVLDPDRGPIESYGVPAHDAHRNDLMDHKRWVTHRPLAPP